jgi:hypothetical protein
MRTYSVSNDKFVWFICDCWVRDSSWAAAAVSLCYLHYNCVTHYFIDLLRNMFLVYCASWNARWRINRHLLLETWENIRRVLCFLWRCNDCFPVRMGTILFAGRQHIRISCGCRATLPTRHSNALRSFFCDKRAGVGMSITVTATETGASSLRVTKLGAKVLSWILKASGTSPAYISALGTSGNLFVLTFQSPVATLFTTKFSILIFYLWPTLCIYVLYKVRPKSFKTTFIKHR